MASRPGPLAASAFPLAAVDLGSNSFRLLVCSARGDELEKLVSLKETVRLAAGLDKAGKLDDASRQRAISALRTFGETLREYAPVAVHAVATNTLRIASNADEVLTEGARALGYPIEVIPGYEEARLIYLGVAHRVPSADTRLVVDIGGGSTELIIGRGLEPIETASLQMGCVGYSLNFFADGELSEGNFAAAEAAARDALAEACTRLKNHRFENAIGSSGTARALAAMIKTLNGGDEVITRAGLATLRRNFRAAGRIDRLKLKGLRPDRAAVIAGGYAIMTSVFDAFEINQMHVTRAALREGVLYELLDRVSARARA